MIPPPASQAGPAGKPGKDRQRQVLIRTFIVRGPDGMTIDQVASILEGAILKRRALGRTDGLAVIAEGIGEKIDPAELAAIPEVEVEYDSYGHIRLAEIPIETILKREIQRRFKERGDRVTITDTAVGYELRCADPTPFDIDYTRTLGFGATRFLLSEPADPRLRFGGLISLGKAGHIQVLPFEDLEDPVTGRTAVRLVDIESEYYQVARSYMIRLEQTDLDDPIMLETIAESAGMTPAEFRQRFLPVVSLDGVRA